MCVFRFFLSPLAGQESRFLRFLLPLQIVIGGERRRRRRCQNVELPTREGEGENMCNSGGNNRRDIRGNNGFGRIISTRPQSGRFKPLVIFVAT